MKLKRRRASEAPAKIRCFIDSVTAVPLEKIAEPLKAFVWEFDMGDFHHWVDLFNHFESFFDKHIKPRKDLHVEDNFLDGDPPFPKEAVLQVLRIIRIVLDNCTNKHFYSSYEQHLSLLLASTDEDVVEACLQTLAAFLKKQIGKHSIRDTSLSSKLFSLAQGWGGKEEGLGLISCAIENGCDQVSYQLGCTLHFEFYASNDSTSDFPQGLRIIHISDINIHPESDLELLNKLINQYNVPPSLRFSLLTRLRFAKAFSSLSTRQQYTCIRLYAFIVLVQASSDSNNIVTYFNSEPEFVNELVTVLSYEDAVPEKIKILCLHSLVALSQDRSRQPTVLTAVTSGGHREILSNLVQKSIDSVNCNTSKWSVVLFEALLSLISVLVSSSSGCAAMREAGLIPTLVPLIKDTDPQHLHLVSTAVNILEAFMDYSNPAASLFRDMGGLEETISRLKLEVSRVEGDSKVHGESSDHNGRSSPVFACTSGEPDSMHPLYSDGLVLHHRRLLLKALLRAISLGTYAPGNTSRVYGSEESLLPECLCIIFRKVKDFGGGIFYLAATVMSDLIHKDPTCFSVLNSAGLPSAFLDAILDGVVCSTEAITCIPQCLDALCLNNNGLQAVKDRNALRCFVKIFTSKTYLRALTGDAPGSLSAGLDELLRHQSSLRGLGVDMFMEILNTLLNIGSGFDASASSTSEVLSSSAPAPMETDTNEKNLVVPDVTEPSSDSASADVVNFLPECVGNVAELFENVLQNAELCRLFVEKKGIDAMLQLFVMPLMPASAFLGQSVSVAFKNFSPQHSASLARTVCSYLREHLKTTNELLVSFGGTGLLSLESAKQTKVLRCLSSLEGMLFLSSFLLKGTASVVSELSNADADVLKDLGVLYREVIWQISLFSDSKSDEKRSVNQEAENSGAASSNYVRRESNDHLNNDPNVGFMNPVSIRSSNSQSVWGGDRDFFAVVRSGEGFQGRTRHAIARSRGGRTFRNLEAINADSVVSTNVPETSSQEPKKKSTDVLFIEILNKLSLTLRGFFTALVKGFTAPNRRRIDGGSLSSASKTLATALAKIFLEAISFQGYSFIGGHDISLSVKCRYLGKVVDDITTLMYDNRRKTCYTAMVNSFYVHGTFKDLLTTFEATYQLLWTLPFSVPSPGAMFEKSAEETKFSNSTWLLDTLQSYCRALEYFVNSALLLASGPTSQTELFVQPASVGLSIGLFPVPRDPEAFVRSLQSQVMNVILPVWNHPKFPNCSPHFVASIISLVKHICSGVVDVKQNRSGISGSSNQRLAPPPPDEATVATIVEMGFSRARAEDALRRIGANSVEMAMEWLFNHPDDPIQEDGELAQALALSLGSASETSKGEGLDKPLDVPVEETLLEEHPFDDITAATVKLFQSNDSLAFPLTDLLVTLCNRRKGENRPKVVSYLIQQLKLTPLDFSKDTGALSMIPHILALLLSEDDCTREVASRDGLVPTTINILMEFQSKNESANEFRAPKCISSLLLILDTMLQCQPRTSSESLHNSPAEHVSSVDSTSAEKGKFASDVSEKELNCVFESIFGKSTGYLTVEESQKVLLLACGFIKHCASAMIMQAVLKLCARLTKTHFLALQFLENGGLAALFSLPKTCLFPGYDIVTSAIIRHLLEDPQTLQIAMESEIRQTLSGKRHVGRMLPRTFLTSMAAVVSRDPVIFMKAAAATCQLDSSGGRTYVMLSKEKDKQKAPGGEHGLSSNETLKISDNKLHDASGKCSRSHKRVPANLTQVIDQLLDIVLKYPTVKDQDDHKSSLTSMEVDEPAFNIKGKSKVDDAKKIDLEFERSAGLAKVAFLLKLLSDIVLMYAHAVGVILRRDSEISQLRGSNQSDVSGNGGVLYHIIHRLLPISTDKQAAPDVWKEKLSGKASCFLVILCSRSSEGRKRVINELVKILSSFSALPSNSSQRVLLPEKKVHAFTDLVCSILSKNSSSSSLPGSGCSPDVAKSMIDGGIIQHLTSILQVIDLDHPDAPKTATLILKCLETLTRAANASEQIIKSEGTNKKKCSDSSGPHNNHGTVSVGDASARIQNSSSQQEVADAAGHEQEQEQHQVISQDGGELDASQNPAMQRDMSPEIDERLTSESARTGFIREDIEGGALHNAEQLEMSFHIESRGDHDVADEDDDMEDDGEDDEDDDEGDDEDEDLREDGGGVLSLAETDMEDPDETGLVDEYNDELMDEEDDDFHENRVIEVRWREALDGLDHLQILGQHGAGSGLVDDLASETFEGVNVDDLFGLRRPIGFERRRQSGRSSFERSTTQVNGFQHPLFARPPQNGASVSAPAVTSSRDLDAGNYDLAQIYILDRPVLPFDQAPVGSNLYSDRLGGGLPPPLADYSVDLLSRRGPGSSRWTDDGHQQASSQASAMALATEEQFISQLRSVAPPSTMLERQSQNGLQRQSSDINLSTDGQPRLVGSDIGVQHDEGPPQLNRSENIEHPHNLTVESSSQEQRNPVSYYDHNVDENPQQHEPLLIQPLPLNSASDGPDNMELGEGNSVNALQVEPTLESNSSSAVGNQNASLDIQNVIDHAVVRNEASGSGNEMNDHVLPLSNTEIPAPDGALASAAHISVDVEMHGDGAESIQSDQFAAEPSTMEATQVTEDAIQADQNSMNNGVSGGTAIDPTFLEALPEDLRAEVLASQQAQSAQPPAYAPPPVDDIDPEFLAALPPDIQAEVLAQQRAQRIIQQSQGQPVDMDNASIIATLPADLREEVLLTSSEAVLAALPSPLLAEAQMLRDRARSHYQARSIFGSSHRLNNRRNGLGYDRQTGMDRGVGVAVGQRTVLSNPDSLEIKEIEGEPLLDASALKSLIRLLRLAQPLGKGLLQRLLLNLCAHSVTRAILIHLLLDMIRPEAEGSASGLAISNPLRLYGCQSNVVYGRSQQLEGLPPLVFRRVLEILTYLATNHSAVADMLFCFDSSFLPTHSSQKSSGSEDKGKEKFNDGSVSQEQDIPVVLFLKLLNQPLILHTTSHLLLIMGLLQVIAYRAASKLEGWSPSEQVNAELEEQPGQEASGERGDPDPREDKSNAEAKLLLSGRSTNADTYNVFLQLPQTDLRNLCMLLGREGMSDKIYTLAGEVMKKLAGVAALHRKFLTRVLSELAHSLSASTVDELANLRNTQTLILSTGSTAGTAILRVLQVLSSLTSVSENKKSKTERQEEQEEHDTMLKLNAALEPLWEELSECISMAETHLDCTASPITASNINTRENVQGIASPSSLPPGTHRLLPLIEAFFLLCEKIQAKQLILQQDHSNVTAREVKECASSSASTTLKCCVDIQKKLDSSVTFGRFAEKHRRLLNSFIRQNPSLLEKSLSMMLSAPRLIDFDNKKTYFRSRIRQQHDQHISGTLRVSVRRAYILEDSYNQLRMRSHQDMKGRLNVQFQGEEGIDAGGLTREWYQSLSRVIFDKGALLFTTVGNNATFQPNPNSVFQTEHLSYFKFVGRVVAKALFDGQLLDVYFTRSFYKHILGVKVTYHDIEAVDPDYYKNLKWMLENDVSDILDLTFSMDADEEKHILYEKTEVTDYELKPGGRNTRVTEETKHEYVDLVADHILTNAIRPQINAFLEGFTELIPRELISIFNDKELELLISGLPEIDLDDLNANAEYTGYTAASSVVQWFWEVVKGFSKEDMARLLQFVTGTSKVPLEGFRALQGISGPQRFQIHKAYGAPERLPSAHTCFNQLDLPEYSSKEQLQERLLLAIHEASEGFGFA